MRNIYLLFVVSFCFILSVAAKSVTEGTINANPLTEAQIKEMAINLLVRHTPYACSVYHTDGKYSYFGNGESSEHGARTNADYAFICAFLYKYAPRAVYPAGITRSLLKQMAIRAIEYSCSTHVSDRLHTCTDGKYWGSGGDKYRWESSLWAESIGYAAWFLQGELTDTQQASVKAMLCAESDHQLTRTIPTGYISDTKAEENGWDTNVLSVAASLYPNNPRAKAWIQKSKEFAMNSYSSIYDAADHTMVDGKPVCDWYLGKNLYDDYTLENHDFFHTSYQNIVIQELSESALAFKMMQHQYLLPQAFKHNVMNVWEKVLTQLALADGELAMPNGNDWSMYLYDQLASYAALATIYHNPDALMFETMAMKYTAARQQTTSDGAFMLHPDIGERRMAVTGRRIAFTYLYHEFFPIGTLKPSLWKDFSRRHEATKLFPYVRVIRANSDDRFASFSWMKRKGSYMGMIATSSPDKNKIWIPYRSGNTGNFTGSFQTDKQSDATLDSVTYCIRPKSFSTNGILRLNGNTLLQYLSYYVTPGNAVIYLDQVVGTGNGIICKEYGVPMGVSMDPFTSEVRTLYSQSGAQTVKGDSWLTLSGNWVNIDNQVGAIFYNHAPIAFAPKQLINSIYTSVLYGAYSVDSCRYTFDTPIASRNGIFYSNISAANTARLAHALLFPVVADGWKSVVALDTDGRRYMQISHFFSDQPTNVKISFNEGAPVFTQLTTINGKTGCATFNLPVNTSQPQELLFYIFASQNGLQAVQAPGDAQTISLYNRSSSTQKAIITALGKDHLRIQRTISVKGNGSCCISLQGKTLLIKLNTK